MRAGPPEARLAAAAAAGLALVLVVIVVSVAIRLGADVASPRTMVALRGVHRTSASLEVLAMLALAWFAWRERARNAALARAAAVAAAITLSLSVLGIVAGQNPPRAAALGNVLGGLTLAAAFAWALGRARGRAPSSRNGVRVGHALAASFAAQCMLGAWLSIFVQGAWSWALVAHAELGLVLAAGSGWLALRLARAAPGRALLGVVLAVPVAGLSAISGQPLVASLAHATAVALLVAAAAYAHARLT